VVFSGHNYILIVDSSVHQRVKHFTSIEPSLTRDIGFGIDIG